MSLDCVHCWMSKCWSVQLQWHILTDPSEPQKGPPKPPERFSDLLIVQITLLCDGLLTSTLWSEVKGYRGGHVSLLARQSSISHAWRGRRVPFTSLKRGAVPDTWVSDCWQSPFTAALGSTPVSSCSHRIYIFGTIKKIFLHKHRNQCSFNML